MRKLILESLECRKTEDWTGGDECRLEVFLDGTLQQPLRHNLNDGQKWQIDRVFTYSTRVEVKLWDEDSPDADDFLGTIGIGAELRSHTVSELNQNGADYKLYYSVEELQEPAGDPIVDAINDFERSGKRGIWPNIPKAELIGDIRRTVANPYNVAQDRTQLCGPAAIIFELVRRQPLRYVKLCQTLYEEGQGLTRTKAVRPSNTLVRSRVPSGITLADWILLATLRDTENALFDVDANSGPVAQGITTPWEMKGWSFEILGYDRVGYESTYLYGEFEAMRKAERAITQAGAAFLMVNAAILGDPAPTVDYPDHWISFLGGLVIDEGIWNRWDSGHIKFDCYSWGMKRYVDLPEGPFEDFMWGAVTATS